MLKRLVMSCCKAADVSKSSLFCTGAAGTGNTRGELTAADKFEAANPRAASL